MSKHHHGRAAGLVDPDFTAGLERHAPRGGSRHAEHKSRQLCRQAQRALNLALAAHSLPGLEQLYVAEVSAPAGDGHLLVHFVAPAGARLPDVLAALRQETPRLRAEVARHITRKRAPELTYVPATWQEDTHD